MEVGEGGGRGAVGGERSMERTNSPHDCLARHLSQGGGCNRPELQPEGAGPTAGTANRQKYDKGILDTFSRAMGAGGDGGGGGGGSAKGEDDSSGL